MHLALQEKSTNKNLNDKEKVRSIGHGTNCSVNSTDHDKLLKQMIPAAEQLMQQTTNNNRIDYHHSCTEDFTLTANS